MEGKWIKNEFSLQETPNYFYAIEALITKASTVFPGKPRSASIDLTFWNMAHLDYNESYYTLYIEGYVTPTQFLSLFEIEQRLNRLEILFRRF